MNPGLLLFQQLADSLPVALGKRGKFEVRFRMVSQVPQGLLQLSRFVWGDRPVRDRQAQGPREREMRRRLKTEKPLANRIGDLIVFRTADAVDEDVCQQQSGKHRRDQCPRAQLHAVRLPLGEPLDCRRPVAVGTPGQRRLPTGPIGEQQLATCLFDKQGPARGVVARPDPERRFGPTVLGRQIGDRLGVIAQSMYLAILGQSFIMGGTKSVGAAQQSSGKPTKRSRLTDETLGNLQAARVPSQFQLMTRLGHRWRQHALGLPAANRLRPPLVDERIAHQRSDCFRGA